MDERGPLTMMRERAEALDRALQSLTPGGSEFVHDPERCVSFVREARASEMRALKAAVKRAQEAECRAAALEAERDKNREWALAAEAEVRKLKQEHVEQGAKRDALEAENGRLREAASELLEVSDCRREEPMGELKRCPFCGHTPDVTIGADGEEVRCSEPGCRGDWMLLSLWNRRASDSRVAALREALDNMVRTASRGHVPDDVFDALARIREAAMKEEA